MINKTVLRKEFLMRLFVLGLMLVFATLATFSGAQPKSEKAVFAGGCFWCMTPPFEKLNGVEKVLAGYTGGKGANPNYENYAAKGHVEAVEVTYDPSQVTYNGLLKVYWRQVNPTDSGGQFCDRGPQYRPVIFYQNDEQKKLAEESKEKLGQSAKFDKPITTGILAATTFYPAEEYHQDYYKKHPIQYKFYRFKCGRDQFLEKIWGKSSH